MAFFCSGEKKKKRFDAAEKIIIIIKRLISRKRKKERRRRATLHGYRKSSSNKSGQVKAATMSAFFMGPRPHGEP